MNNIKQKNILIMLCIVLVLSILVSTSIGQLEISIKEIAQVLLGQSRDYLYQDVILNLRLPRILLACLVGCGLALCGAVMQTVVQNPLADPYILGISSGASLGATFAIILSFMIQGLSQSVYVSLFAFVGAVVAMCLVYLSASSKGKASPVRLILAGVIVNTLCTALSNFLIYSSPQAEGIRLVTFWTMGSLANTNWLQVTLVGSIVGVCGIFFLTQRRTMNILLVGDEVATTLGISVNFYRKLYMALIALITGVIVAHCGIIGFVGLIVPHAIRGLFKTSDNKILPIMMLSGSIFLIWVDLLSRVGLTNTEIPIGIITSVIGAPLFLFIFIRQGYGFNKA